MTNTSPFFDDRATFHYEPVSFIKRTDNISFIHLKRRKKLEGNKYCSLQSEMNWIRFIHMSLRSANSIKIRCILYREKTRRILVLKRVRVECLLWKYQRKIFTINKSKLSFEIDYAYKSFAHMDTKQQCLTSRTDLTKQKPPKNIVDSPSLSPSPEMLRWCFCCYHSPRIICISWRALTLSIIFHTRVVHIISCNPLFWYSFKCSFFPLHLLDTYYYS